MPRPRIKSRLIIAAPNVPSPLPVEFTGGFFKFLSPMFQQKRKKLKNIFKSQKYSENHISKFQTILQDYEKSIHDRPEDISLPLWIQLFQSVKMNNSP
ncbi:MAG: hypothetical protein A2161_01290 [Candidatus Schekmanbacteria bacterium RBG_13_48_7]|uniref:Uncharacterized protein n=1 Tax=Candidatus Schekmanbacteria bacterium RBG_13_48_7 TaxID=1817878 RepID=A0A1F7S7N2_9BACT|nr:MAG: hypothetical protein A2161_01290 [Candidatus Schekmanbacteria bacterium RBG_13_48_7]